MMKSDHGRVPGVKAHCLDELEKHIENTLSSNWILRVEHTEEVNPAYTQWQQWGKAQYCVREAEPVIRSIQACRLRHPSHSVRLNAETTSPRTRFIYPVYHPDGNTGSAQILPGKWRAHSGRGTTWLEPLKNSAIAARTRAWRIITVTGMLLGSFLVFEEVIA